MQLQEKPIETSGEKLLSICIPTYNGLTELKKALSEIVRCSEDFESEIQICVSDNASTDGTFEYLKEFQKQSKIDVKVNRNEMNKGADYNIFRVLSMGDGKFCWLFGDDEYPINPGYKKLVERLRSDKDPKGMKETNFIYLVDVVRAGKEGSIPTDTETENRIEAAEIIENPCGFISVIIFRKQNLERLCNEYMTEIKYGLETEFIQIMLQYLLAFTEPAGLGYAVKLQITPVATVPSWEDIRVVRQQLEFMAKSITLYVRGLRLTFDKRMNNGPKHRKKFVISIVRQYAWTVANFIMAKKFRDAKIDMEYVHWLEKKFGVGSILLILPYFAVMVMPVIFARIIYRIGISIAVAVRLIDQNTISASEKRWAMKPLS